MEKVYFLHRRINVITGVSGAGKTSLVMKALYPNIQAMINSGTAKRKIKWQNCDSIQTTSNFSRVMVIDRTPIAKSSVSMPATYLDVFGEIRTLFAKLPDAALQGYSAQTFSLHREGGRCEECRGRGEIVVKMRFLADTKETCSFCRGRRYRSHLNKIKYKDYSIMDVLELTLAECLEIFKFHKKISSRLQPAVDLGLGYLKMGQPTASLSGGESQRLKLTVIATKKSSRESLILIDEPTLGLHPQDTSLLLKVLNQLRDNEATFVIVEHDRAIINEADWIIELGPGAADNGGELIYQGTLSQIKTHKQSRIAPYL